MIKRRGRWTYGDHVGLNPGWRLDDTNLVLDYNPLMGGGDLRGAYVLFRDGHYVAVIDHYVDGAMAWVEANAKRYLDDKAS